MTTALEQFLSASMPPPRVNTYSAHDPAGGNFMPDPNKGQTPMSPPALEYLTVGAGSYRALWTSYTPPTTVIGKTRAQITAVLSVPTGVDLIEILSGAMKGSVSLLTSDARTIVAYRCRVEQFIELTKLAGFPAAADGSAVALLQVSASPIDYRAA